MNFFFFGKDSHVAAFLAFLALAFLAFSFSALALAASLAVD